MEFRQHFTKHAWWGKLICAFLGFIIAGPIGAFFGLLIGNFFDRGLVEHFSKPFWYYHSEQDPNVRRVFFESMFAFLGCMAKADGHVTQESIRSTTEIMQTMGLSKQEEKAAQHYFNLGKAKGFDLYALLDQLKKAIGKNPNLVRLFIETQYQFIRHTGITNNKLNIMNNLLVCMHMAPLHNQTHFKQEFSWFEDNPYAQQQRRTHQQYQSSSSYQHYRQPPQQRFSIDDAYAVLGLTSTATQQEVKRAYRRKISQNHPDKLIAKGASESAIKAANEKTQRIRKAYENICQVKGW